MGITAGPPTGTVLALGPEQLEGISSTWFLQREEGIHMQCLVLCSVLKCTVGRAGVGEEMFTSCVDISARASSSHSQLPSVSPFGAGIGLKVKSQLSVIWLLSGGGQRVGGEC